MSFEFGETFGKKNSIKRGLSLHNSSFGIINRSSSTGDSDVPMMLWPKIAIPVHVTEKTPGYHLARLTGFYIGPW